MMVLEEFRVQSRIDKEDYLQSVRNLKALR